MAQNEDYILEILMDVGLVTRTQVDYARSKMSGSSVIDSLIQEGFITQEDVGRTLAAQNGMDFMDLAQVVVPPNIIELLRAEDARRWRAVPVGEREGALLIAIGDPMDMQTMDDLAFKLQREVEFVCATPDSIRSSLVQYYGGEPVGGYGQESMMEVGSEAGADDAPIIKMVSLLLVEAHQNRASDI
ncbi:MAG: type II/IV secretion system protein, partial [Terrimicrobiaceae bacterium]